MPAMDLTRVEEDLCRRIAHGEPLDLEPGQVVGAEVLRHILLNLPLIKKEAPVWRELSESTDSGCDELVCPRTAVGISIRGGAIEGRIKLDSVSGKAGGPLCPLHFDNVRFDGGFSGANSHFGRLSFTSCTFNDAPPREAAAPARVSLVVTDGQDCASADAQPAPTIELSGATVDGNLDMRGIRPAVGGGLSPERLWIRAVGIRIGGNLNLSCAHLRAPDDNRGERDVFRPAIQPLDISLARIDGDFHFLGDAISEGPISARSARIAGDVWMSRSTITCRPGDERALFFQLANIGGGLMLDGRREKADGKSGSFRPFRATGTVNLFGITVGGSIVLNDAELASRGDEDLCLCLTAARVGGRIEIEGTESGHTTRLAGRIRLDRMEVSTVVTLKAVELGSSSSGPHRECIDARVLTARHLTIEEVRPIGCKAVDAAADGATPLSINLQNAQLQRLTIRDTVLTGPLEAAPLYCNGDVVLGGTIFGNVDLEGAGIGGSLDLSALKIKGERALLSLKDATIGHALRLVPRKGDLRTSFELSGAADLTSLTCDTLDDDIGRAWGDRPLIQMNHFTYRRTGWLVEGRSTRARSSPRKSFYRRCRQRLERFAWPWNRLPQRRGSGERTRGKGRKPSYRIVSDWIQAKAADGRLPWRFFPAAFLSDDTDFCEPWQHRRNWIYQHYRARRLSDPFISRAQYEIREKDYRPHPFEQAIKVARAEGREDFATHFEIHKQYLEWRFFNERVRWGLALIGITLATFWLLASRHAPAFGHLAAILAYSVTVGLMIFGSAIRDWLRLYLVFPVLRDRNPGWIPDILLIGVLLATLRASGVAEWPIDAVGLLALTIVLALVASWIGVKWRKPGGAKACFCYRVNLSSKLLTWAIYWLPAVALLLVVDWIHYPFDFFVAFLIFITVRLTGVLAHQLMRIGFMYMRRPIRAVGTLIFAFVAGWVGVGLANSHHMFVVAAEPVAGQVAPAELGHGPDAEAQRTWLAASARGGPWARDVPCRHELSEPLYALDVLIPLVDLHEEDRCEIRRIMQGYAPPDPAGSQFGAIVGNLPELTVGNPRFWWWMKALYAIAGWILVSLALLTFAQVNRTHGEAAEEPGR